LQEDAEASETFSTGDFVAVELPVGPTVCVFVGKVLRVFTVGSQLELLVREVPYKERYGPWTRRPWIPQINNQGDPVREHVHFHDVLAKITLENGALSVRSLEIPAARGVPTSEPTKDRTLPARRY
jgi:hypothetical protein